MNKKERIYEETKIWANEIIEKRFHSATRWNQEKENFELALWEQIIYFTAGYAPETKIKEIIEIKETIYSELVNNEIIPF